MNDYTAVGAASTRPKRQISSFNPITNLSAWTRTANQNTDKRANFLTLHSLVTPAPLNRRQMSPQTILTTIHPSLRAWLAPLIFPRLRTAHHEGHGFEERQSFEQPRFHGASAQALNQYNLDQHLLNLLLASYGEGEVETDSYGPRKREAVDVLQDSARVAHHVNGLLADYESQRKFPPHPTSPDARDALATSPKFQNKSPSLSPHNKNALTLVFASSFISHPTYERLFVNYKAAL